MGGEIELSKGGQAQDYAIDIVKMAGFKCLYSFWPCCGDSYGVGKAT